MGVDVVRSAAAPAEDDDGGGGGGEVDGDDVWAVRCWSICIISLLVGENSLWLLLLLLLLLFCCCCC